MTEPLPFSGSRTEPGVGRGTKPDAVLPVNAEDNSSPAWTAQARETHSAVVLLLGDHAYKFKKPVDLGFLDFTTRATRQRVCRRELELNRRLAADVYLDVITVSGSKGNAYEDGIVMRRMPDNARLATLVRQGAEVRDHLRSLARLLAAFHSAAERGPKITAEAGTAGLRRRWTDNLRETEVFRGASLDRSVHEQVSQLALRYVDGRQILLDERVATGRAVDGHGDLTAEDIFCLPDHPRVLDCIEFDDRLRWVDVLDDVAFLAMDLERLGRADLARDFMGWYLEFSGEPAVESLQHHYVAYRAFVRAKVSCIQAAQGSATAAAGAAAYAQLALRHLRAGEVTLLLVGGAPGTGKTTLSCGIACSRGWVVLSSDEIRNQIFDAGGDRYSPGAKLAVYTELLARARRAVERGVSVVADATWGDTVVRGLAAEVAVATSSRLVEMECHAPLEISAARAQRRLATRKDGSEADARIARQLAATRERWPSAIAVDTAVTPRTSLEQALMALEHAT